MKKLQHEFSDYLNRDLENFFSDAKTSVERSTISEIVKMTFESAMISAFVGSNLVEKMLEWLQVYFYARGQDHREVLNFIKKFCAESSKEFAREKRTIQKVLNQAIKRTKRFEKFEKEQSQQSAVAKSSQHESFREYQEKFLTALVSFDKASAYELVQRVINKGINLLDIYEKIFAPTLWEIGYLWQTNRLSVVVEHYSSAVIEFMMSELYGQFVPLNVKGPKVLVTCPRNERHAIGARMFADALELEGFNVDYLGADTPETELETYLRNQRVTLVCLSVTLGTRMLEILEMIKAIRNVKPTLPIVVGGQGARVLVGINLPDVEVLFATGLREGVSEVRKILNKGSVW